jgi:hypothetical protein
MYYVRRVVIRDTILMQVRWDLREKLSKLRHNRTKGCSVILEPHKQIHYHINMSKKVLYFYHDIYLNIPKIGYC